MKEYSQTYKLISLFFRAVNKSNSISENYWKSNIFGITPILAQSLVTQTTLLHPPDIQTTPILPQTHRLPLISLRNTHFSHSHQTLRLLAEVLIDTHTANSTQTHRLMLFSPRLTDYSHSHSETQTTPILTQLHRLPSFSLRNQTSLILTQTPRLLSFSLRHQTTPILTQTHRQISFSIRHPVKSHSQTYT